MSNAVCISCDQRVHWRARRGTRLKDIKCPDCNGDLRAVTSRDWDRWRDQRNENAMFDAILEAGEKDPVAKEVSNGK